MADKNEPENTDLKALIPGLKRAEAEFQKSYTHQGVKPDGPAPTARVHTASEGQSVTNSQSAGTASSGPTTSTTGAQQSNQAPDSKKSS